MSIIQSVVEICEKNAGGSRVTSVVMEVGELSGVVPEAIEFCFEACTRDTLLDGARLVIERTPAKGTCTACGGEVAVRSLCDPCPVCGAFGITIVSGMELRVKELEVE